MAQDIFAAITANDQERVVQLIVAEPAVAHARNAGGISALMQARYENRLEIVDLLRKAAGELDIFEAATLGDVARLKGCWPTKAGWSRRTARMVLRRCTWRASSGSSTRLRFCCSTAPTPMPCRPAGLR